jgi:hypothetical protein
MKAFGLCITLLVSLLARPAWSAEADGCPDLSQQFWHKYNVTNSTWTRQGLQHFAILIPSTESLDVLLRVGFQHGRKDRAQLCVADANAFIQDVLAGYDGANTYFVDTLKFLNGTSLKQTCVRSKEAALREERATSQYATTPSLMFGVIPPSHHRERVSLCTNFTPRLSTLEDPLHDLKLQATLDFFPGYSGDLTSIPAERWRPEVVAMFLYGIFHDHLQMLKVNGRLPMDSHPQNLFYFAAQGELYFVWGDFGQTFTRDDMFTTLGTMYRHAIAQTLTHMTNLELKSTPCAQIVKKFAQYARHQFVAHTGSIVDSHEEIRTALEKVITDVRRFMIDEFPEKLLALTMKQMSPGVEFAHESLGDRIRKQDDRIRKQADRNREQDDHIRKQADRNREQDDHIRQQADRNREQDDHIRQQADHIRQLVKQMRDFELQRPHHEL